MALVSNVLGYISKYLTNIARSLVLIVLLFTISCSPSKTSEPSVVSEPESVSSQPRPSVKQVETPALIRELTPWLDGYEPQVQIQQPQPDAILNDTDVSVMLWVKDLPIYKDKTWAMGPHIELLLDNQPYGSIYDIEQPIILEKLTPGTHTIRAFATKPWNESFKNEGAYAQVTFHVLAKTNENRPTSHQPLLTYGTPVGTYGAEPVLLDFYLTDTPLHQVAQDNPTISDWQVQYIVNGESFMLEDWTSTYIEGLNPGQNWVQLMLLDTDGNPIEGIFNNTVRLIDYDPSLNDSLAKIIRGDVTLADVGSIIDPTYEPPVPEPPEPEPVTIPETEGEGSIETGLDTGVTIPEVVAPNVPDSEVSEPEAPNFEPEVPDSEVSEPEGSDSEVIAPEMLESSEVTVLELTRSQMPEPSITTPEAIESETANETSNLSNVITPDPMFDEATEELSVETDVLENSDIPADMEVTSETDEADSIDSSTVPQPKRRYLQRLYDYRERSMQTYGRDR